MLCTRSNFLAPPTLLVRDKPFYYTGQNNVRASYILLYRVSVLAAGQGHPVGPKKTAQHITHIYLNDARVRI